MSDDDAKKKPTTCADVLAGAVLAGLAGMFIGLLLTSPGAEVVRRLVVAPRPSPPRDDDDAPPEGWLH